MTGTQVKTKEGKEVATETAADLEELMRGHAGKGISNKAADNLVPQIAVLQPLSPEVREGEARIDAAKPGDFLIGDKAVDGKKGIWFQPCFVDQTWLEFTPLDAGGGFVAQHDFAGTDASGNAMPPAGAHPVGKMRYRMDNGNEVVHYRQLAGVLWDKGKELEKVLSFKSTGHTVMREWMTKAGQANRFANGDQRALYAHVYHLTSELRRKGPHSWYVVSVGDPVLIGTTEAKAVVGEDPKRAFLIGAKLADAFASRERQAERIAVSDEVRDDDVPM